MTLFRLATIFAGLRANEEIFPADLLFERHLISEPVTLPGFSMPVAAADR